MNSFGAQYFNIILGCASLSLDDIPKLAQGQKAHHVLFLQIFVLNGCNFPTIIVVVANTANFTVIMNVKVIVTI